MLSAISHSARFAMFMDMHLNGLWRASIELAVNTAFRALRSCTLSMMQPHPRSSKEKCLAWPYSHGPAGRELQSLWVATITCGHAGGSKAPGEHCYSWPACGSRTHNVSIMCWKHVASPYFCKQVAY